MSDKPTIEPHLKGADASRALRAAITGADPTRGSLPDVSSGLVDAKRSERQALIAASLASGMIAQRRSEPATTAAEAVVLWREVLQELRNGHAPA